MNILKDLCSIQGASGHERGMRDYLIDYIKEHSPGWKRKPKLIYGEDFQDCLIVVFGKPRTAIFAHMDTVGFTVRYDNQLIPIGGPDAADGIKLVGRDSLGEIECTLKVDKHHHLFYEFGRGIERGTALTFKPEFRSTKKSVQCCYLDNRLGIYCALKVCETLKDGIIVFSAWEEHGGGSVPYLVRFIYENYSIRNYLVCDVTWVTEGIHHGKGAVISLRDRNIPRRNFLEAVLEIARNSNCDYQLEVENDGSSDGRELQLSPYPVDWCFIGPPESHVHSPDELVYKNDIENTICLLSTLIKSL